MFAMISALPKDKKAKSQRLLHATLAIVCLISLGVLSSFFLLPELIVTSLLGAKYLPIASSLGTFGIAMTASALAKVFVYFFLATEKINFLYPFTLLTFVQIGLILFFHSNIGQITNALLITSLLLLVCLTLTYVLSTPLLKTPPPSHA
jgi:hypothetical protein